MSSETIDVNGAESQYKAEEECLNIVTSKRNQTPAVKSVLAKITNNGDYKIIPSASNQPLDFTIIEPETGHFKGGIEHFSIGFEYTRNKGIRIFSKLQTEKGKETYHDQFPISKGFIDVLKTASLYGIEDIILTIHDTWGRDHERVLYFNTNNMEKSCKRQNLAICNDFKPFSFPNITDVEVVYRNGQFDIYYSFGS